MVKTVNSLKEGPSCVGCKQPWEVGTSPLQRIQGDLVPSSCFHGSKSTTTNPHLALQQLVWCPRGWQVEAEQRTLRKHWEEWSVPGTGSSCRMSQVPQQLGEQSSSNQGKGTQVGSRDTQRAAGWTLVPPSHVEAKISLITSTKLWFGLCHGTVDTTVHSLSGLVF